MKVIINCLAGFVLMMFIASCTKIKGEGPIVTENRNLNGFSSVSNTISGTLNYKQENIFRVEIQAQQNILDVIRAEVINNELVIKFKNGVNVKKHEPIVVNVSSPTIKGLRVSGSGDLLVQTPLTSDNLSLTVSGSGNITVSDAEADELNATISGSGNITMTTGYADQGRLTISGSGSISMQAVEMREAVTRTSGSGQTRLTATERLEVHISGSGSVYYKGSPVVNSSISGSGNVVHVP